MTSNGSIYVAGSNQGKTIAIPLDQYEVQVDPNPTIIKKKSKDRLTLVQNVSLKFLKPPQPEQPGDITIIQESDVQVPAAPPVIFRLTPDKPRTPEPLIIRERPPVPPNPIAPRKIVIPGRVLPPPPRQVITERLAPQPAKPQDIIIERWLGYPRRTRNVIFQAAKPIQLAQVEKNILIEWEVPDFEIKQEFKFLGVQEANPRAYASQYGTSLVDASRLPREAAQFATPAGAVLAVDSNPNEVPILRGAVQALRNADLNCNGLSEYANQI